MATGEAKGEEAVKDEVLRASGGDPASMDRVLGRWIPAIEGYMRKRAGRVVLDHESAADLAQSVCREALARLGRGALEYRGEAALKQWLFGAADLKLKNRFRYYGAQRREAGQVQRGGDDLDQNAGTGASPSQAVHLREERAAIDQALAVLDPRQREAVRLFHLEGRDHRTVAEALGITESHSRTLVARALARLARQLREG